MKLTIYTEVPSNNKLLRMHWAERRKLKAVFTTEIWVMAYPHLEHQNTTPDKVKKRVVITLFRRGRRYDTDNAYGGAKLLIDCLQELGLIWNDSKVWLDLEVKQELDHENPRTEIMIEEAG